MDRRLAVATLALAASGCASPWPPPRSREAAPLYRLACTEPDPKYPASRGPSEETAKAGNSGRVPYANDGPLVGLSVEIRVDGQDGRSVVAPTLLTVPGRPSSVEVFEQLAYVRDFDVERKDDAFIADPVIGILQDGAVVEVTALRDGAGGATTLAWEVRTAEVRRPLETFPARDLSGAEMTIQLPSLHRADAAGVRRLEDGVWSLLARLPDAGGRPFSVLARVKPVRLNDGREDDGSAEAADGGRATTVFEGDSLPARAARGEIGDAAPGLLEVRGVVLRTDLAAGSVVEAEAASRALDGAVPLDPADFGVATGLVRGARACCLLQESYLKDYAIEGVGGLATADPEVGEQVSGLVAEVEEGGALRLTWNSTPDWQRYQFTPDADAAAGRRLALERPTATVREARVFPAEGTRLVVLSRLEDGRSAGMLVRFRADGAGIPR